MNNYRLLVTISLSTNIYCHSDGTNSTALYWFQLLRTNVASVYKNYHRIVLPTAHKIKPANSTKN